MSDDCYCEEKSDDRREKLYQALLEYHTYISNNREFIPNYAERYRYFERVRHLSRLDR